MLEYITIFGSAFVFLEYQELEVKDKFQKFSREPIFGPFNSRVVNMEVPKSPEVARQIDNIDDEIDSNPHDYHHRNTVSPDDASSIRSAALGDDLPKGYFYSFQFLGAMAGFCLSAISAYIFLILPTNVLTYINADIGKSHYSARQV
jgi:hypothetical protein